jgi:uncharacterized delta-60 repeat protein
MRYCFWPALLLALFSMVSAAAQGPRLDAGFQPAAIYAPAIVRQAIQQPDGKRIVVGYFQRLQGTPIGSLVRFMPGGNVVDAAFQANIQSLRGYVDEVLLLPTGQLLLATNYGDSLKLGGVGRRSLLRLNADGTPDASFDAGAGLPGGSSGQYLGALLAQPDGKVVVSGDFTRFGGQPAGRLVRLNPNGSLDATFLAAGSGLDQPAYALELQPDGKILVGGQFTTVHGQARSALVRLLPSGQLDSGFTLQNGAGASVAGLALQADGAVLVAFQMPPAGINGAVLRLFSNGVRDTSFELEPDVQVGFGAWASLPPATPIRVQADGRVLLAAGQVYKNGEPLSTFIRLLPTGARDVSFTSPPPMTGATTDLNTVQVLGGGQLLVAGNLSRLGGLTNAPSAVAVLQADGTRDPSFGPNLQWAGAVHMVVQQPDGKLLVGGDFNEINGTVAHNLARLNPDGSVDTGFTQAGASADDQVYGLALQPDGKVLLTGSFQQVNGVARGLAARLLSTGALDAGFVPNIAPSAAPTLPNTLPSGRRIAVAARGHVVVGGLLHGNASNTNGLVQLDGTTGQVDASFQWSSVNAMVDDLVVQPDGKLVVAGYLYIGTTPYPVCRLLPSGALDPSFARYRANPVSNVLALALDPAGRIYIGGSLGSYDTVVSGGVVRLLADGTPDPSFISPLSNGYYVRCLAMQPNGRLLAGGSFTSANQTHGTMRFLPTGTIDSSYQPASGPRWTVEALCIQADGGIVAGGNFLSVAGASHPTLVRLLDSNVLATQQHAEPTAVQAWPVPAHGQLQVRLDQAATSAVELVDALGRVVRTARNPGRRLVLDISALPAGVYLLRVQQEDRSVVQRVVIE